MKMNHDPLSDVLRRLSLFDPHRHSTFDCGGYTFEVHEGVFPPTHFQSTAVFTEQVPVEPGRSFLEIGCGAGVTAVMAAVRGAVPVVATDISARAVRNARANAARLGVAERVSVRQGDLFDVLGPDERFDTIFWNSNFVFVPDDYELKDPLLLAFCDPGYTAHRRFLRTAPSHLTDCGRILLGFSNQGDQQELTDLLGQYGYSAVIRSSTQGRGESSHRYDVLELKPPVDVGRN